MEALHVVLVILIVTMIVLLAVTSPKHVEKEPKAAATPQRDALDPLPDDPDNLVDVECHDKLAVYKHELEFHVLVDPEKIWNTRFEIPKSWLELDDAELLKKLSRGIDAVYVRHRQEWSEGGDLNYPALVRARFRVRSKSELLEKDDSAKLHRLDERAELVD